MANPDHLALLTSAGNAIGAVAGWRARNPVGRLDLAGSCLTSVNLNGIDLSASERHRTRFTEAELVDVNFGGANLLRTVFSKALIRGVQFDGGNLERCHFNAADIGTSGLPPAGYTHHRYHVHQPPRRTSFRDACLKGADFREARIVNADMRGANLAFADMRRAELHHVDLEGADLSGSRWAGTILCGVEMPTVIGLDSVHHLGPSYVDADTLCRFAVTIPDEFLRGVGLSESLIAYLRSHSRTQQPYLSCFISYSHQDRPFVLRLHDSLQSHGVRCWLDEKDINPGDRILDVVADAIGAHDKLLLCCSEASLSSWWVRDEIDKAIDLERRESRNIVIPILLDDSLFRWNSGLSSVVRSRLAADFTRTERSAAEFGEQIQRLLRALEFRTNDVTPSIAR